MIPRIKKIENIDILKAKCQQSNNGVDIYSILTPAQDVVRISLVFNAGIKYQDKSYIATATANLLSEGTENYTSHEIAQMLDFYGIYYDVSADREFVVITVCALGRFEEQALLFLEEVLLRPLFNEEECKVYTQKRKISLQIEREKINVISREAFAKSIFGEDHHYGTFADAAEYDNVTVADLSAFYKKHYTAKNLFVVLSGNITERLTNAVADIVAKLPDGERQHIVSPQPSRKAEVKHIKAKDSVQTALNIGRVMFDRSHPDFIAMQLTSTLLGGYFSSRLMKNLREEKGYTYGIQSALINMQDSGYFIISTQLQKEFTDDAIEEIFKEIEILKNVAPQHEELEMVKRVMVGEMLRILDGPFGIADVTIENIQNKTDNSATELMVQEIWSITPEKVQEIAKKYLAREDLSVIFCN